MACSSDAQCSGGNVCLGGVCSAPTVLLLGGSSTQNLLAGTFQATGGWTTTSITDTTSFAPSLTVDSTGRGVGVYASVANSNAVAATVWSGGAWGAPVVVDPVAVARSTPYVDATASSTSYAVYQNTSYQYVSVAFTGTWSSPKAVGSPYYGPFAATIAATSAGATVSYFDGAANPVNTVTTSDLASGTWTAGATSSAATTPNIVGNGSNDVIPTAIVTLSGGTNQMLVYVDHNAAINFMTRTGVVTWPAPAVIANCTTDTPVGLAPLANGDAILAFRGQDGHLYWTVYSHTSSTWSAVAAFSSPNVAVDNDGAPVAVTHGIGGDTAEIAYVSSGKAYHARLAGSTWSTPVLVGGSGLTGVAIAAAP